MGFFGEGGFGGEKAKIFEEFPDFQLFFFTAYNTGSCKFKVLRKQISH